MKLRDEATTAWTWKAIGCAACIVGLLYILSTILAGLLKPMREIQHSVSCQGNVFRLTRAFRMYADDYDDRLPPSERWMDTTFFYVTAERYLHCPAVSRPGEKIFGYSMNLTIGGKTRASVRDQETTPLLFDSDNMGRGASDNVTSMPNPGRHRTKPGKESPSKKGNFVGYVDGSARIKLDSESARK